MLNANGWKSHLLRQYTVYMLVTTLTVNKLNKRAIIRQYHFTSTSDSLLVIHNLYGILK